MNVTEAEYVPTMPFSRDDWDDDIYFDAESNGEGDPHAMVRYAYEAGQKAVLEAFMPALREIAEGRGPNELTRDGIVTLARAALAKVRP